ncbi:MAG: DM13 domain-containing protein [Oculatellaceae cyanobacterium bins.114]|nr:DM13 domain-containing protein [Oculatellaceae cyanobacterium bins.114]
MKLNRLALSVTSVLIVAAPMVGIVAFQGKGNAEQLPAQVVAQNQSVAIASGTFVAGEAPTTGVARIVTEGGHRYLELDGAFSTSSMGPDLHVLLDSTQRPPQTYTNLGSAVNLGSLREYTGAQRYPIPDSINLASFRSVVVWCRTANATFGYAPLTPASSASIR